MYNKCKYDEAEWKRDKIKFYSEQCNNDLIDNQSWMLNSVLNREKRHITLNRIMVTDQDAPYISTDPADIKWIATKHYQLSAGIPSNDISIPNAWIDEFNPKSHIDASNYQDLINPITEEEYSQITSALPNNKASGLSTITYKSVKHAGPLCHSWIITLLNACLDTTLIPHSWHHVLLFPIPKPMDWKCHIDKIWPIVLLEILQKILGKILT